MLALIGLLVAGVAAAQSVAPEVLLLARVKAHTRAELARLPNCSCLQTVRRSMKEQRAPLGLRDVLRLEVLYSDGREYYAFPGEKQFTESHPRSFTAGGTIGNGHFALYLSEIAGERGPSYEYKGKERLQGRELARWDYHVPLIGSGHAINVGGGEATVGMNGSFWADPATYEIVRIQMAADEIPPTMLVLASETWIEYAHTTLGGQDYLLPQTAEMRLTKFTGEESLNHIEFTHCRLFAAQSSISFGSTAGFPGFGEGSPLEKRELPPGLTIVVKVNTAIGARMAVGALVEGTVEGNVSYKKQVVIPGGSVVRGRVRRLQDRAGTFAVSLEFTDVEAGETHYRFFADLQSVEGVPGVRRPGSVAPELLGVGTFVVEGPRVDVGAGFRMTWKTRSPGE